MARNVLVLGATSPMARAAATELAARGDALFLASRDENECKRLAQDLTIRFGAKVFTGCFEASDFPSHDPFINRVVEALGPLDVVLVTVGDLGATPNSLEPIVVSGLIQTNLTGLASVLGCCAAHMMVQGMGVIVGVGSVAGDRGRQSNFVYGAAKGGFAFYLQGLRNLLHTKGVRVVTFKPGFIDTAMTYGKAGVFLAASPQQAGRALVRAIDSGSGTVYFPWFWRWIMLVIRCLPEPLFMRMKL